MTVEIKNTVLMNKTVEIHQVSDSVLFAWGENNRGQLGIRTQSNTSSPVQIGTGLEWSETYIKNVTNGIYFTAATKTDGTLWVWGDNFHGTLGTGNTVSVSSPVQVGTSNNWSIVKCGNRFMVGIKTDGSLWSWGRALNGYLGTNQTTTNRNSPVQVGLDKTWNGTNEALAASSHVAAIKGDGSLWLWGINTRGQLGDGTVLKRSSPVQLAGAFRNFRWLQVAVGFSSADNTDMNVHTAAIRQDGTLWLWGENFFGGCGTGVAGSNYSSPMQVLGGGTWKYVSVGYQTTMAVKSDNTLWVWGRNDQNQLGLGDNINRSSPVQLTVSGQWKNKLSGFGTRFYSCASLTEDNKMFTWGQGSLGQLGYGLLTNKQNPIQIGYEKEWTKFFPGANCNFCFARTLPFKAQKILDLDAINYFVGNIWQDSSGLANNAVLNNLNSLNQNTCIGFFNFPANNTVAITQKKQFYTDINSNKKFSVECWFRTIKNQGKIVGFEGTNIVGGGGDYNRHLYVGSDGGLYFGLDDSNAGLKTVKYGGGLQNTATVCNGAWHHAVGTFDNGTMKLYVNGNLIQQAACQNAGSSEGYWRVGGFKLNGWLNGSDSYFNGQIASVKVYNYDLTAADVTNNYNMSKDFYPQIIYNYIGYDQYFNVPSDVFKVTVTARGGRGFRGGRYNFLNSYHYGGTGGCIQSNFTVSPNSNLLVVVGNGDTNTGLSQGNYTYGYGGRSEYDQSSVTQTDYAGAGGGLAGIFNFDPTNTNSIKYIVAGGGGGGGMQNLTTYTQGFGPTGGNGGDQSTSGNGTNAANTSDYFSNAAGGATLFSVGRGGKTQTGDGINYCCGNFGYDGGFNGANGWTTNPPETVGVQGGRAAYGIGWSPSQAQAGGGGAGYNGGGGGATASSNRTGTLTNGAGMGGGGGSSFAMGTSIYGFGNQCGPGSVVVCFDDCGQKPDRSPSITAGPTPTPTPSGTQPTPTPSGTEATPTPTPTPSPSPTLPNYQKGVLFALNYNFAAQTNTGLGYAIYYSAETADKSVFSYYGAGYKYIDENYKLWGNSFFDDAGDPQANTFGNYRVLFPDKSWKYVTCLNAGSRGQPSTTMFGITLDGNLWNWGYPPIFNIANNPSIIPTISSPIQILAGQGRWVKVVSTIENDGFRNYFALNENGSVWGIGTTIHGLFGGTDTTIPAWKQIATIGNCQDIIGMVTEKYNTTSLYGSSLFMLRNNKLFFMGHDVWKFTANYATTPVSSPLQIGATTWNKIMSNDYGRNLYAIDTSNNLFFLAPKNGSSFIQVPHHTGWKNVNVFKPDDSLVYATDTNNTLWTWSFNQYSFTITSPTAVAGTNDWISLGIGNSDGMIGLRNVTITATPSPTPTSTPTPTPSPTPSPSPSPTVTCPPVWGKFDGIYYQNGVDKNALTATTESMTNGSTNEMFCTAVYCPRTATQVPFIMVDLKCDRTVTEITLGNDYNKTMIGNYGEFLSQNCEIWGATSANDQIIQYPDSSKQIFLGNTGTWTTPSLRTFPITPTTVRFIYIYNKNYDYLCLTEFYASGTAMVTPTPSPSPVQITPTPTPSATLSQKSLWYWPNVNITNGNVISTNPSFIGSPSGYNVKFFPEITNSDRIFYIDSNDVLWCWAHQYYSPMSPSSSPPYSPVQVTNNFGLIWKSITNDYLSAAAISTDGQVYVWGRMNERTGNSNTNSDTIYYYPQKKVTNQGVVFDSVYIGSYNIAAISSENRLYMLGLNVSGQLGNGITRPSYYIYSTLDCHLPFTYVKQVVLGNYDQYTLMLKTDGTIWGMGNNFSNNLATGNNIYYSSPVQTIDKSNTWKQISKGVFPYNGDFNLGVKTDGTLWVWGCVPKEVRGNSTDTYINSPVQFWFGGNTWSKVLGDVKSVKAIKNDNTLWCWGVNYKNSFGNLNLPNNFTISSPVQTILADNKWVSVLTNASSIYIVNAGLRDAPPPATPSPSPTITPTPTPSPTPSVTPIPTATASYVLFSWGRNNNGQLGTGTIVNASSPALVLGNINNWKSISNNASSSANTFGGIKSDGSMWMWGANTSGMLGNNATTNRSSPTQTVASGTWTAIAIGSATTAAIKSDSTLWTWGANTDGALGANVPTTTARSSPVAIGGNNWKTISAGLAHFAATKTDNTLWVWGRNTSGQLGLNNIINYSSPVQVAGSYKKVSCGEATTAAIDASTGILWTWGSNSYGMIGNNSTANRSQPTQLGFESWIDIALSRDFVYGLKTGGFLFTWGRNTNGQLGDNTVINKSSMVSVSAGVSYIGVCQNAGYYIDFGNRLWNVGQNLYGQIGNNTIVSVSSPTQSLDQQFNWFSVAGNIQSAYALKIIPGATASPTPTPSPSPTPTPSGTGPTPTPTPSPTLFKGQLLFWGSNTYGQHGNNTTNNYGTNSPNYAINGFNFKRVKQGNWTLGIKNDGTLWSCGYNAYGQLGTNDTVNRSSLIQVMPGTTNWKDVFMGGNASFAIKTDGTLWGWGKNAYGELGNGTFSNSSSPTQILPGTNNWLHVACGFVTWAGGPRTNTMGIKTDGTLWAWGYQRRQDVGLPTDNQYYNTPTRVGTASDWIWASVFGSQSFAIKKNGTLWVTGTNYGQFGNGYSSGVVSGLTQIGTATTWKRMYATYADASIALKTDGTLWGCGRNQWYAYNISSYYTHIQLTTETGIQELFPQGGQFFCIRNGVLYAWRSALFDAYPTGNSIAPISSSYGSWIAGSDVGFGGGIVN